MSIFRDITQSINLQKVQEMRRVGQDILILQSFIHVPVVSDDNSTSGLQTIDYVYGYRHISNGMFLRILT